MENTTDTEEQSKIVAGPITENYGMLSPKLLALINTVPARPESKAQKGTPAVAAEAAAPPTAG